MPTFRLYHVDDAVGSGTFSDDIDDMGSFVGNGTINTANNYSYDAEGRLIKDTQEQIASIDWRVDGKVKAINRTGGSSKKNLKFDYNAMGNRIAKHVLTSANVLESSTYYILDAQGNVMSTYEREIISASIYYSQKERYIYGSSRLGVMSEIIPLYGSQNSTYSQAVWNDTIGRRSYELSNHLGNVLSVISDIVEPVDSNSDQVVDYYLVSIRSASDYSPFGVQLENRNFLKTGLAEDYRMGFPGQEEDDEVKGDGNSVNYTFRMHDPRLGRFLSIDPKLKKFPWQSPYVFAANNPIFFIDNNGESPEPSNPSLLNVWEYLSQKLDGSSNSFSRIQALVILYHESKLQQFNSKGQTLVSGGDFGIGQINKKTWANKTQLANEGISKVDWERVESSWEYNVSVALAILDNESKSQKRKNSKKDESMSNRDIFISTYARYNGGHNGYEQYLDQYSKGEGSINEHIHGKGGLFADLHNFANLIDQKILEKKEEIESIKGSNKQAISSKQKELKDLKLIRKELLEFKKKVGEHSSDNSN